MGWPDKGTSKFDKIEAGILVWPEARDPDLARSYRNRPLLRVFALRVVACGHVPSESGRGQAERGASKKLIHETGIRRNFGPLPHACRANGMD
jgi:hypothetical protein